MRRTCDYCERPPTHFFYMDRFPYDGLGAEVCEYHADNDVIPIDGPLLDYEEVVLPDLERLEI